MARECSPIISRREISPKQTRNPVRKYFTRLFEMTRASRSSLGCYACKERKVKCDEKKPSCGKCVGLKQPCPGYKDPWEAMHREENAHVAKLVQGRVTRKLKERQQQGARVILPQPIHIDIRVSTLNHFYGDYSLGSSVAFLGILPSICAASPASCFLDAIHATALASSSRQRNESRLMIEARRHYGKALMGLNKAIQRPETSKDDSVLASLFLLGLFEAISAHSSQNRPIDTEASCHPHSRGGLMLLQHRSRINIDSELDRTVLRFFSHIALMESFMSPPGFTPLWSELKRFTTPWSNGPLLEPLILRAVELKAIVEAAILDPSQVDSTAVLMERGMGIMNGLETAAHALLSSNESGAADMFNGLFDGSNSVTATIAACLYTTVRLHVIELMLILMITVEEQTLGSDELGRLSTDGATCLQDICEHICAVFGFDGRQPVEEGGPGLPFRAWCMLWPMVAVMSSSLAEARTKLWIREKLRHVGITTGFGLAMMIG